MNIDQMEQLLQIALWGNPEKEVDENMRAMLDRAANEKEGHGREGVSDRIAAVRLLAILMTPPEKPDPYKLMEQLIVKIWEGDNHRLLAMYVDPVYPKDVVEFLLREKYITRTLSGYALRPDGATVLRRLQEKEHQE